ncbi:MAG: hypothetical protein SOR95_08500 [Sutterella sp.]|nr:hypothetical protein [Sutterella sp.]
MVLTKPVYVYDSDHYFCEQSFSQSLDDGKTWIDPPNCTELAPVLHPEYWPKFENGTWVQVAKPKTAEECLGVVISHTSDTPHDKEYRDLMEALTKDSETYRLRRGEKDQSWYVEEINDLELALQLAEKELREHDSLVHEIEDQFRTALLMDEFERMAELKARYKSITTIGE